MPGAFSLPWCLLQCCDQFASRTTRWDSHLTSLNLGYRWSSCMTRVQTSPSGFFAFLHVDDVCWGDLVLHWCSSSFSAYSGALIVVFTVGGAICPCGGDFDLRPCRNDHLRNCRLLVSMTSSAMSLPAWRMDLRDNVPWGATSSLPADCLRLALDYIASPVRFIYLRCCHQCLQRSCVFLLPCGFLQRCHWFGDKRGSREVAKASQRPVVASFTVFFAFTLRIDLPPFPVVWGGPRYATWGMRRGLTPAAS